MKRIFSVLTVMAITAAMVTVMAMPAMAGNVKAGKGEPLVNDNKQNYVTHCGPFLESIGLEGYRGTTTTNSIPMPLTALPHLTVNNLVERNGMWQTSKAPGAC